MASAINSFGLPAEPRGYMGKYTNVSRTTSVLVIGEPMVLRTLLYSTLKSPYVAGNSRGFYCSVTNVERGTQKINKTQRGLPRPLALFK